MGFVGASDLQVMWIPFMIPSTIPTFATAGTRRSGIVDMAWVMADMEGMAVTDWIMADMEGMAVTE
jgi:hypothetical protein